MGARRAAAVAIALGLLLTCGACSDKSRSAAVGPGGATNDTTPPGSDCNWPMWGQNLSRTFSYPCPTAIAPTTAKDLTQRWFFNTKDVVTATPAVASGRLFVGDWAGTFYAIDAQQGTVAWTFQADVAPHVYAGQIVSSAAVTDVGTKRIVIFAAGPTVYALDTETGAPVWRHSISAGGPDDFTEIESSPIVADGKVIVGSDVHNHAGQQAGVTALDVRDGSPVWFYDTDEGAPPSGCVDVWGSAAVDPGRRSVFFGTGSCDTLDVAWQPNSEALVAIDLDQGTKKWSYQPHEKSVADLDFAGAPNLFEAAGKALVGLGNKDGTYYALDRDTGSVVWKTEVTEGGPTGGFIGPTVYAKGLVAGGTAVGRAPFLHALDASTGRIVWQQAKAQATYAASAEANGVLFSGGTDFTFRAFDLLTGAVLWSAPMAGVVAGGAAIVGDDVFAVAGLREPGSEAKAGTSGVYRFSLAKGGPVASSSTTTSTATAAVNGLVLDNTPQPCLGAPCAMRFLKGVPAGITDPTATLEVTPAPFSISIRTTNLGDPGQWVTPGSDAAAAGATSFALFISESDETLQGGLLCTLDASGSCTATSLPALTIYNRITLLAVKDTSTFPTPADGLARLVTTVSFDPPLNPKKA